MGKSIEESASQVDAAPIITASNQPLEKGKREAEDAIEQEVMSAKKQKVDEEKNEVKTEKNVVEKKVETSSEVNTSSLESEQQIKVKVSAKNGHVGSNLEDKSSGLEEHMSAAKKTPAVAAKNGHLSVSKKKDESSDDSESSAEDEASLDKDAAATKEAPASLNKKGPVAPAKKTDESNEDSDSSENKTSLDEDIAAANETKKSEVATQRKDASNSDDSDFGDETSSDKNLAKAKKAPAGSTNKGPVVATNKKNQSSCDDESSGEDDVTAKITSEAVTKKKEESIEKSESDNKTSSSDDDPQTPATPKVQTTGPKTLYVGNLSFSVEQEDIEHFFKAAGEVVNIRFAMNSDESFKGFGYVEFASTEAAEKALHELNGKELLRRPVRLDFVKERGSFTPYSGSKDTQSFQKGGRDQGQRIFVHGFNKFDGEDQIRSSLEEHFGSCGKITRVAIPKDQDGGIKGIAFIEFKDNEAFNQALELNGSKFGESTLSVEEAKPRGDSRGCADRGRGRGRSDWRSGWREFGGRRGGCGTGGWFGVDGRGRFGDGGRGCGTGGWFGGGGRSRFGDGGKGRGTGGWFGGGVRGRGPGGWFGGGGRGRGPGGWFVGGGRG